MWKNKHVIVALLVAPLLAILAWFAVDRFVAEQPAAPIAGGVYPLVAKSGCRYAGGLCELKNSDLVITIMPVGNDRLRIDSSHGLDRIQIAVAAAGASFPAPENLASEDSNGLRWTFTPRQLPKQGTIRLVAYRLGASFYAETSLEFTQQSDTLGR